MVARSILHFEICINQALGSSRTLVVLCSPRSVHSTYVNDEIVHFKRSGKSSSVFAAVISGDLGARTVEQGQSFPDPLYFELGEAGEVGTETAEPLAADFRLPNGEEGWTSPEGLRQALREAGVDSEQIQQNVETYAKRLQTAKLKLISGVLAVELGELTKRDKAYQLKLAQQKAKRQRRLTVAFALIAIVAVAGLIAYLQSEEAVGCQRFGFLNLE